MSGRQNVRVSNVTQSEEAAESGDSPHEEPAEVPIWAGGITGAVALACGLAFAELVTSIFEWDSPLVEVGNRVVDLVPKSMRDWAISTFGTSDKVVLLGGVSIALLLVAVLAGTWMVRGNKVAASVLIGAVLVVGSLAPLGRGGSGPNSMVAILLGGAVAIGVMWILADKAAPLASRKPQNEQVATASTPASADPEPMIGASRRRFLVYSGVGAGAAAVGAGLSSWIRSQAAVASERLGVDLPQALQSRGDVPAGVSVGVDGVPRFITPNEDFYRIDTALVTPRVSTEDWTMRVHGLVDNEIVLNYEQLLDRPMVEADITIACVSNEIGGDLIGTARWLGTRLDDLLEEAGIAPSADQIVGRSVDGFTAGFPTDILDGRDALVAVGMNGVPLPVEHGYPARLIVPGVYGYVSATKWLSEIEVTTFADFEGYWIPRGWDAEAPVVTMSRIDTPKSGDTVAAGETLGVGGVAWAMNRGIDKVEVSIDGGPWEDAELGEHHENTTWRQWGYRFEPDAGDHEIKARATDTDGYTQTDEQVRPGPNAATGHHTIRLTAG